MPKNQFQRPLPVKHDHKVPRHGAPVPVPKPMENRTKRATPDKPALPTLDDLLHRIGRD